MRTVREACELGDDAVAWRTHVLQSMSSLIGADWSMAFLGRLPFDAADVELPLHVHIDLDPQWLKYFGNRDLTPDPCTQNIIPRLGIGFTETREQLCDNQQWYTSEHFNEVCRPSRVDHYVMSILPLRQQGFFHTISFGRRLGGRSFDQHSGKMLGLLHEELDLLWKRPSLIPESSETAKLSPRLRQVLDGFVAGFSEKQIARKLGLAKSTIHNHVSRLHRVMDVSSRGELLAKTGPRPSFRPRLLPA
jgi:DNA-binding CsgD family transcriptional regulator